MTKPFFDTNILIYAFHETDSRAQTAQKVLEEGGVISVQNLNEFVAVAVRKLSMNWAEVHRALGFIRALCPYPVPVTMEMHEKGLELVERYGYRIYDCLLIAAALEASCDTLYSQDMQNGQVIEGLTIRNPFTTVH